MTFMPALASSAAMIPPAAPTPMMTTSVLSVAMVPSLSRPRAALQPHDRLRESLRTVHVGFREGWLGAWKTGEPPSCEILVAAVHWVAEHSLHDMHAHGVEKCRRRGPCETRGLSRLHRREDLVLLLWLQEYEALLEGGL